MRKLNAALMICFALILASAALAQSPPGVNNAELNGNYAFSFTGSTGSGGVSSVFAAVGRFTADGTGNLTKGELDTNGVGAGATLVGQAFTGTYAIGADHRGVMTFNIPGGARTFAFAMMANGNAQFIEFDAAGGSGIIGSGTMEKSDTAAYSAASIIGDYAFGVAGLDHLNNRVAIAGRFTSNGAGTLANAAGDLNAYGSVHSMSFTAANYTVSDTATGRGTMSLAFSFGGIPASLNFVFYIVNAGKLFVMERDSVSTATPLLSGEVLQQQIPAGGFSSTALNGRMVIHMTGLPVCGGGMGLVPKALAGLFTFDGLATLRLTFDENFCRAPNSLTDLAGTFIVASNGRTSMTVGTAGVVAYLVSSNQVIFFSTDTSVLFGFGEPQATAPLANGAVSGVYAGFASTPATFDVTVFSGEFTADGASPTGTMTGTVDIGAPGGPSSGVAFNATYSVSSSPTNGRGTMTLPSGNAVVYAISSSKFVAVPMNDPNPAVWIFERASPTATPPPTPTLSSLVLSPTTVVGGAQSSTGTVTLSGPAPSGDAVVSLSSSNTNVATVPSSVTVAAGATSATFTVSTSPVTASTTVTISASYGGVTRTASLTVNPVPLPTLSSLTLNPTSVVGGVQSSTGTVTLSGSAPSGGAVVSLASSNTGAATVPSSVAVPAGATSATFTVSTSGVTASTPVTISSSYGGATRTASLTVTPQPNYTLSASPSSLTMTQGSSRASTITITPRNGFSGSVSLSASGLLSGVTASFSPNPATTTSTLTLVASNTATTGTVTVTIKGTSGSLTNTTTITLTVTPTLTSLTLSPTTVIGGLQSSTGTVTLSGPAPSGGSVVSLFSSNTGAARVPPSVTVPAGATSATFTVNTSLVLFPTSVTISATYNSTTRTASLAVW